MRKILILIAIVSVLATSLVVVVRAEPGDVYLPVVAHRYGGEATHFDDPRIQPVYPWW